MLTRTLETEKGPLRLCIGAATSLTAKRPGNGGFRLLTYTSDESMAEECVGLAQGMEIKVRSSGPAHRRAALGVGRWAALGQWGQGPRGRGVVQDGVSEG